MAKNVAMPKFGLTMTEGTITEWFVKVGDEVKVGDPLCEVETDKLTNKVESRVDGVVKEILVGEDEDAEVQQIIAVIE
ncbi:MAG: biotin/lipoyl-binding protein [Clostridia bacterium]|nr:biotin/lipoyl-binding protein [Clostridia bacterium]MBR1705043.1 biotin/lipoyl-binding protein [Clostridia bacterium]